MAFRFGQVPEGDEKRVAQRLVHYVRDAAGGRLTTGILNTCHLSGQLSRFGHGDIAVGILRKEDYPSVGYLLTLG